MQQDCRSLLHDLAGSKNDGFYRTQSEMGCVSTITATLNLRSGPSTSSDIIVRIPPGTFVNIDMNWDSMVSDFFRVDVLVDGILYRGYVSKDYILYRNIFHV